MMVLKYHWGPPVVALRVCHIRLRVIYPARLSWKCKNQGHNIGVKYMKEHYNAC